MADRTTTTLPIGQQVSLSGHFDVPVVLEGARPLAKGFECRVRMPDGTLDEAVITQEEAAAHLIVKRQILNTQKELMDEVYRKALDTISSMPESFHKGAISSLLRRAEADIPEGTVSCCARDESTLKEVLKGSEFSAYSFGSVIGIDGGIIVKSTAVQIQVDFSYRTFMMQVWESGLKEASDILFA